MNGGDHWVAPPIRDVPTRRHREIRIAGQQERYFRVRRQGGDIPTRSGSMAKVHRQCPGNPISIIGPIRVDVRHCPLPDRTVLMVSGFTFHLAGGLQARRPVRIISSCRPGRGQRSASCRLPVINPAGSSMPSTAKIHRQCPHSDFHEWDRG